MIVGKSVCSGIVNARPGSLSKLGESALNAICNFDYSSEPAKLADIEWAVGVHDPSTLKAALRELVRAGFILHASHGSNVWNATDAGHRHAIVMANRQGGTRRAKSAPTKSSHQGDSVESDIVKLLAKQREPMLSGDIRDQVGADMASVRRTLQRLERDGIVERLGDRRWTKYKLLKTSAGSSSRR